MEYLIPIICAYVVYVYNYKKVIDIRYEIKNIRNMNEEKFWDKLDKLGDRLTNLEIKVSKLETRLAVYTGLAVFVSSAVVKWVDKIF